MTETEQEEPVVVPDEKEHPEAPPSWLKETSEAPPEDTSSDNADLSDGISEIIKDIHHRVAVATSYDGFEITDGMLNSWRKILRVLLRKLPGKDWPLLISVFTLALGYVVMGMGYVKFRKQNAPTQPVKAPTGAR
jgi:hypothetical protein